LWWKDLDKVGGERETVDWYNNNNNNNSYWKIGKGDKNRL